MVVNTVNAEQIEKFTETKIVAVVRKIDSHKINYVVESLIKGGMKSIEITMDSENCLNHISDLKKRYPTDIFIGAGTVLDTDDAKAVLEVGADFVVSPIVNREMIEYVKERNKIVVPGAFSPTEIYNAYEYGATMVKLFPANVLGPGFIKDIKGPLGHIPIMTTGGIDLNRSEEHTSELQSRGHLVCRLLLEK